MDAAPRSAAAGAIHVLVMGAPCSGKSATVERLIDDVYNPSYRPTFEENFRKQFTKDGQLYQLDIVDVGGGEEDGLPEARARWIADAEGVMYCYALDDPESFKALTGCKKEVIAVLGKNRARELPSVVVGTKRDLISPPHQSLAYEASSPRAQAGSQLTTTPVSRSSSIQTTDEEKPGASTDLAHTPDTDQVASPDAPARETSVGRDQQKAGPAVVLAGADATEAKTDVADVVSVPSVELKTIVPAANSAHGGPAAAAVLVDRAVPEASAREFADSVGAAYVEVTAKDPRSITVAFELVFAKWYRQKIVEEDRASAQPAQCCVLL